VGLVQCDHVQGNRNGPQPFCQPIIRLTQIIGLPATAFTQPLSRCARVTATHQPSLVFTSPQI
jgi:hypothetical protein